MPYYTIPQRIERLRAKSAAETSRRSRPALRAPERVAPKLLEMLYREREVLCVQIAQAEYRLQLLNDLIAMYEK